MRRYFQIDISFKQLKNKQWGIKEILVILFWLITICLRGNWQSEMVKINKDGQLSYLKDSNGFVIPDFSYAGFRYGEKAIPQVATVKEISPILGDNTLHIQNAIDELAALVPNKNGFRGALLLKAGTYNILGSLYISESGIVIRGEGQDEDPNSNTILLAKDDNPHQRTVIILGSKENYKWTDELENTRKNILNDTVKVGEFKLKVENTNNLSVGDNIIITHPCTSEWLESVNGGDTGTDADWKPGELPIIFYRYIKAIRQDTIELDAPVFSPLIKNISPCYIFKHSTKKIKQQIGVENLRLEIETGGSEDENHAWDGIRFNLVEDGWAKDCTAKAFGHAGFVTQYSYRISITNCSAIDPVAKVTGARMYNFNFYRGSQLILIKDCYARNGRHHYVSNGTTTVSGCVVYNCVSDASYSAIEGHRKWSTGLLFDNLQEKNLRSSGRLVFALYNRGDKGTAHGWSAAHSVAWNCDFGDARACIQKPPNSQNYAIGCFAKRINGHEVDFPQKIGYVEGTNVPGLEPASLYQAQLKNRIEELPVKLSSVAVKKKQILLYPNPSSGSFSVRSSKEQPINKINVIDQTGRLQFSLNPSPDKTAVVINSKLKTGMYIVNISTKSGYVAQKLIVK